MTREIPSAPNGYKPEATLLVTRNLHDDAALDSGSVPTGKAGSYNFGTATAVMHDKDMRSRGSYDGNAWPDPQAYRDAPGRNVYSAVVGIVTFPDVASKDAALLKVRGGPGMREPGVMTDIAAKEQAPLSTDWVRVISSPGATVLYDHVHEGMTRPAIPSREGVSPAAYAAWEKTGPASEPKVGEALSHPGNPAYAVIAQEVAKEPPIQAKAPPTLTVDKNGRLVVIVRKAEVEDAIAAVKTGSAPKTPTAALVSTLQGGIEQQQWAKDATGRLRDTGEIKRGVDALEALREGFGNGSQRRLTLNAEWVKDVTAKGLAGKDFEAVVAKVAAISTNRDAMFKAVKANAAAKSGGKEASR